MCCLLSFNLSRQKEILDASCDMCEGPKTSLHALWECGVVQNVWAGSVLCLQKVRQEQEDMLQLTRFMMDRLSLDDLQLFLVQAWLIWHQRNTVIHFGKLEDPGVLNW